MADPETHRTDEEEDAAGKSPEQQAKEGRRFLEEKRKRELPKDDWPGKGDA